MEDDDSNSRMLEKNKNKNKNINNDNKNNDDDDVIMKLCRGGNLRAALDSLALILFTSSNTSGASWGSASGSISAIAARDVAPEAAAIAMSMAASKPSAAIASKMAAMIVAPTAAPNVASVGRVSVAALACVLKECGRLKAAPEGRRAHAYARASGLDTRLDLGNALIDMYARCGDPHAAHHAFDAMCAHDAFSWSRLISAYTATTAASQGGKEKAFALFRLMRYSHSLTPNKFAFVGLLKASASPPNLTLGRELHSLVVTHNLEQDPFVGSALVDMYAKCGCLDNARKVFDGIPDTQNVVPWNAMICGYAQYGHGKEALDLFEEMQQREAVKPDKVTFASVLKACAGLKALEWGKRIHGFIKESAGLCGDAFVGSSLIDMYAKCGSIEDALDVFVGIQVRDLVLWNSMISGYAQSGCFEKAIELFDELETEGIRPDKITFVSVLKACAGDANVARGKQIHSMLKKNGLEKDVFVGSTLVDMYAKCGRIGEARGVFDRMHERNIVSWNAMITGSVHCRHYREALELYEQMRGCEGVKPDGITFASVLRACASLTDLERGKDIHASIGKATLQNDPFVGNALVDMYAKCGRMEDARKVFDGMPIRDVVSWNAMITGYAQHGHSEEALALFERMLEEGVKPNGFTFASTLKACSSSAALEVGEQIHSLVRTNGLETDVFIASALIDMYAKCGSIEDARQVFDKMCGSSIVMWNAMITGYAQHGYGRDAQYGHGKDALALFKEMQRQGLKPNRVTITSVLKACAGLADQEEGKNVHTIIKENGFEADIYVRSSLVDMYAKCGNIEAARQVFDEMRERSVVSWNAMIGGYSQRGLGEEGLEMYNRMQGEGVKPDKITYVIMLKACASMASLEQGKWVHGIIRENGFDMDVTVGGALVDMYAKCGSLDNARQVFDGMKERNVVSWNAMISGYAQHGHGIEALKLFEDMRERKGVKPDKVTFASVLKACAGLKAPEQGKQIHANIKKLGFEKDVTVGNTLIDMYMKCRKVDDAQVVFEEMCTRDEVTWNVMIAGYAQHGRLEAAFTLLERMRWGNLKPKKAAYISILKACANVGVLEQGRQVHETIKENGLDIDIFLGSTLIDMYAKCGSLRNALEVFKEMHERDVVVWSAMIAGYAQHGHAKEALAMFEQMRREGGVKPNEVTYTHVLSACSHAGLLEECYRLFDSMTQDHGITPTGGHYACMVDLLGRKGHLVEAEDFINKMRIQPDAVVWMALLGASATHANAEIARRAFEHVTKLEPRNAAAFVLLSNTYAAVGRWDEAAALRKEMKELGGAIWSSLDTNGDAQSIDITEIAYPKFNEG